MRLIDADALSNKLIEIGNRTGESELITQTLLWHLDRAPTACRWIPVTESCECDLMDDEEVLVFQKDGTINGQIRHAMFYDFNGKKKFVTWEEGITIYNVVAYMPLPEPYKGVTDVRD